MKNAQWTIALASSALLTAACGGSTPEAETPDGPSAESAESPASDDEFWAQEAEASGGSEPGDEIVDDSLEGEEADEDENE